MAEEGASERTEEPTARRLQKAREDGQVARSVELPTAVMLVTATLFFTLMGSWMFKQMGQLFTYQLAFDRKVMDKAELLPALFGQSMLEGYLLILPIMLVLYVMAIISSGLTGGFIFSMQLISPKFNKLNPLSGLARMFGMKALIELAKSIGKFVIVGAILLLSVMHNIDDLLNLNRMDLGTAVRHAGEMIIDACFWMSMGLVLIAVADVPLQRYQVHKKLKMTKQEIKDEMKDAEGRPEVKAQIRRRQREMANNKMMAKVKDADVVITNPQHFAVALEYDPSADGAPMLIAKGTDDLARRIRESAKEEGIQLFEAPELARALYFTTKVDEPIPESLYHAVAQVIAYVFSLNDRYPGSQGYVKPSPKIPDNMRYDENGFLMQ
ncbi:MAG: Flagellar biosynthetic protein FlhB [Pseudomonadota bacterium]